ncbi:MAG: hydrogenase maturation nickel metallochaperone HypA, partial [Defluviitaleaceae bacterium]|nr:hydrogenase maturation nickel metallochaperone HypA [Defluviitaleaceae bacterium]
MHEASIAESILHSATEHSGGAKVKQIDLVIGESSGILGDSLCMYFDIFAENTICQDAIIKIETVKPKLKCKVCGEFFVRKPFCFECDCGGDGEPTDIGRG